MAKTVEKEAVLTEDPSLTRADLRHKIAVKVGVLENPETPLSKKTLNSVYAWLTGEFHYPREARNRPDHPDFVPRQRVLEAVVYEAGLGEPQDRWSRGNNARLPDGLRKHELYGLMQEMYERADQRDEWYGDQP